MSPPCYFISCTVTWNMQLSERNLGTWVLELSILIAFLLILLYNDMELQLWSILQPKALISLESANLRWTSSYWKVNICENFWGLKRTSCQCLVTKYLCLHVLQIFLEFKAPWSVAKSDSTCTNFSPCTAQQFPTIGGLNARDTRYINVQCPWRSVTDFFPNIECSSVSKSKSVATSSTFLCFSTCFVKSNSLMNWCIDRTWKPLRSIFSYSAFSVYDLPNMLLKALSNQNYNSKFHLQS